MAKSCITVCFTYSLRTAIFEHRYFTYFTLATHLGCGGVFKHKFVANLLLSLTVKESWKSVNIWWSYRQEFGVLGFFGLNGVDRQSTVAAQRAWNKLPTELNLLQSTTTFRHQLNTFLFQSAYEHRKSWWLFCDAPSTFRRERNTNDSITVTARVIAITKQ